MAYQPPNTPPAAPADNYSAFNWFDPQAAQNSTGPNSADWINQWNAGNFGTQGGGQNWGEGLLLGAGMAPPSSKDGTWVMTGSAQIDKDGGQGGAGSMANRYAFIPNQPQAAEAPAPLPSQDDPAPTGPTIYDSTEDWIRIARAEDQGRNRTPFVGPNWSDGNKTYGDIPYDPLLSLEMFYPGGKNDFQKNNKSPYEGGLLSAQLGGMMG